jgi:hypothetical protein
MEHTVDVTDVCTVEGRSVSVHLHDANGAAGRIHGPLSTRTVIQISADWLYSRMGVLTTALAAFLRVFVASVKLFPMYDAGAPG